VPVLRTALQGVTAPQLAACAEVYSFHAQNCNSSGELSIMREIVQEAVRKLSNFSQEDLRRLHDACVRSRLRDPYLDRARVKRFPKALQLELVARKAQGKTPRAEATA